MKISNRNRLKSILVALFLFISFGVVGQNARNFEVAISGTQPPSQSTQRIALVIGNGNYKDAPLANPVNDAKAMAQSLKQSGFSVTLLENSDMKGMQSAVRHFGDQLRAGGGVGLFYYAGHGMQIKGRNYLVPVGAAIEREDEVAYNALDAQAVLDKMDSAGNGTNILILDACRNNPFTRASRNSQQGLAPMDAPVGTLVAFSTAPGSVASDGSGQNGLYTRHLLTAMAQSGSKLEDVFKRVRAAVRKDSEGKQVPWEATSLEGDFYFKQAVAPEPAANLPASVPSDGLELSMWELVRSSGTTLEIQAFMSRFPQSKYSEQATIRIKELNAIAGMIDSKPPVLAAISPTQQSTSIPIKPVPASPAAQMVSGGRQRNEFGYTVGDRWSMQVLDRYKNEVIRKFSGSVTKILPSGDVELNGSDKVLFSPTGNWKQHSVGGGRYRSYEPSQRLFPTTLKVGFTEDFKYIDKEERADGSLLFKTWTVNMKVIGQEKIRVPAGEFDTYRIERVSFRVDGNDTCVNNMVIWYAPVVRYYAAIDETVKCGTRSEQRERVELVDYDVSGVSTARINQSNSVASSSGAQVSQALKPPPAKVSNEFGFNVGDRWNWQKIDRYKGEVIENHSAKITKILPNGDLEINGMNQGVVWSANGMGGRRWTDKVRESATIIGDNLPLPKDLKVGAVEDVRYSVQSKRRDGATEVEDVTGTLKVVGIERVKVPAGEFETYKLAFRVSSTGKKSVGAPYFCQLSYDFWYSPKVLRWVASDQEIRCGNAAPDRVRNELTSFEILKPSSLAVR